MQAASASAMGRLAVDYDWAYFPEPVLGWVMAQKSIDLGTAISVFFNGAPERYNYLHKRNVPAEFYAAARVLDNICLRVNSGFYLDSTQATLANPQRLRKWLAIQQVDRAERSSGRWVLDEAIVQGLLQDGTPSENAETAPRAPRRTPLFINLMRRYMPAGAYAQMRD